jgi:hypothetical protein
MCTWESHRGACSPEEWKVGLLQGAGAQRFLFMFQSGMRVLQHVCGVDRMVG